MQEAQAEAQMFQAGARVAQVSAQVLAALPWLAPCEEPAVPVFAWALPVSEQKHHVFPSERPHFVRELPLFPGVVQVASPVFLYQFPWVFRGAQGDLSFPVFGLAGLGFPRTAKGLRRVAQAPAFSLYARARRAQP
jgi:hypothetical protein